MRIQEQRTYPAQGVISGTQTLVADVDNHFSMDFDGPTLGRYGLQRVAKDGSRLFGDHHFLDTGARPIAYHRIAQVMLQSQQSNMYSEWSVKVVARAGGLSGKEERREET